MRLTFWEKTNPKNRLKKPQAPLSIGIFYRARIAAVCMQSTVIFWFGLDSVALPGGIIPYFELFHCSQQSWS